MPPLRWPHIHIPFFRIFYSTTYTVLYFIVLVLLCVNPAAMIYTAFDQNAYQYIFEIGGTYILTAILAVFIYFSRLYTNRSVMAAVGKSWIPIEEGEVARKVRKMIVKAMERSAIIALESRPRDLSNAVSTIRSNSTAMADDNLHTHPALGRVLKLDPENPPWGRIEHPGWSSPSQGDTLLAPHVNFRTVIHELPNLVEAKAVSLAPPDPFSTSEAPGYPTLADPSVVDLLRRRPYADLRAYLGHLSKLGVIGNPQVGESFIFQYERARFSCVPLSEAQFETLMESFSILLTSMQSLEPTLIGELRADRIALDSSETSSISSGTNSSSSRSTSIAGSVRRARLGHSDRDSSMYRSTTDQTYDTAPSHIAQSLSPLAGYSSRAETPRPRTARTHFTTSETPLRRAVSRETFGSVGSVLRTMPGDISFTSGTSDRSSLRSRSFRSYAGSVVRHSRPSPP